MKKTLRDYANPATPRNLKMKLAVADRRCNVCGSALVGLQRQYCRLACKMRAWWSTHERQREAPKSPKPKSVKVFPVCLQCGQLCQGHTKTCSPACRRAWMRAVLVGKKYRPAKAYARTCGTCGQAFSTTKASLSVCQACSYRAAKRGRGKYRERCRRAGVPYTRGVTPLKVFTRDRWRCQLCGCATPKRLRGTYQPNAPELDHIVPIGAGGGHTWDNVQCACRACNMGKGAKPLGQLRLVV